MQDEEDVKEFENKIIQHYRKDKADTELIRWFLKDKRAYNDVNGLNNAFKKNRIKKYIVFLILIILIVLLVLKLSTPHHSGSEIKKTKTDEIYNTKSEDVAKEVINSEPLQNISIAIFEKLSEEQTKQICKTIRNKYGSNYTVQFFANKLNISKFRIYNANIDSAFKLIDYSSLDIESMKQTLCDLADSSENNSEVILIGNLPANASILAERHIKVLDDTEYKSIKRNNIKNFTWFSFNKLNYVSTELKRKLNEKINDINFKENIIKH